MFVKIAHFVNFSSIFFFLKQNTKNSKVCCRAFCNLSNFPNGGLPSVFQLRGPLVQRPLPDVPAPIRVSVRSRPRHRRQEDADPAVRLLRHTGY